MSKNILCKNKNNKVFLLETYVIDEEIKQFLSENCKALKELSYSDPVYWITDSDVMEKYELPYDEMGYIVFTEDSKK